VDPDPSTGPDVGRRVLLVDDDRTLLRALAINLRTRGWEVVPANDGRSAVKLAAERRPAVVVLDLGLPDMDGLDVIAALRRWSTVPIIVLTARHSRQQTIAALDAGADDYVTKPFAVDELLARVRAAARRSTPDTGAAVVEAGTLRIDLARKRVHRAGEEVRLTGTEWSLLEALVRHRGHLVGTTELLQAVWGPAYGTETNYLRVFVAQLRRKLEEDPSVPVHIVTHPGRGYVFEV
jgi:two-component system, OmpR family, KDP operon response regulator KdpE